MKKQYNLTRLTDELQHSVFFQKPEQPGEPKKEHQSTVAPKHQVTIVPSNDSAKAPNDLSMKERSTQSEKAPKQQETTSINQQNTTATKNQSTLALKHFSSYLEPGTYKAWKLLATEREMKDYEVLQEAVEQYVAREQEREMKKR